MTEWQKLLIRPILCFVGGLHIYWAINSFNSGMYYLFGLYVMMAFWMVAILFDTYKN